MKYLSIMKYLFKTFALMLLCGWPPLSSTQDVVDVGKPLFLTPYVLGRKLEDGRRMAKNNLSGIEGYSGYFTVNSNYNSNLFFWFFPAALNPETAPVLMWLNGGPGASSMLGLFVENGPFRVDKTNNLHLRKTAWTKTHSIIYIDSPVGSGYSFTDNAAGYARTENDVGRDLYSAITQFFKLFPKFVERDFYVTGESYAGKYVPAITHEIHVRNQDNPEVKINLKGMGIGNGLSDPENMLNYGTYLYNVGLIDEHHLRHFRQEERKAYNAIKLRNWHAAYEIMNKLFFAIGYPKTYFSNVTGYKPTYYYNILITTDPPDQSYFYSYIQLPSARRAMHVGNRLFNLYTSSYTVEHYLSDDFFQSIVPWVVDLLEAPEQYKVFFYCGQLDISINCISTEEMLQKIQWSGRQAYRKSGNRIWRIRDDIAGYVRNAKNLMYLMIRNSGHLVPTDQPKWAFDMINRFTSGRSFA